MSGFKSIYVASLLDRVRTRINRKIYNISLHDESRKSKILMFHDVSNSGIPYSITPERFREVIESCKNNKYDFCSLDNMIRDKYNKGHIVITFDDAYSSVFLNAFPYLVENNIPFMIYLSTDNIGRAPYLTITEIQSLAESPLCTFGSHLHHHVMTRLLSTSELTEEVNISYCRLQSIVNLSRKHIALPYGSITACSLSDINVVKKLGVDSISLTTQRCIFASDLESPFKLPRIDASSEVFLKGI